MKKEKRPLILTIICIIGYIWIIGTFPGVFSPSVKKLGAFVPAIYGLIIAGTFISFIGIWYMKRWGVEAYILMFFAKQIFLWLTGDTGFSTFLGIAFSAWFIITFFFFYRKMDVNL